MSALFVVFEVGMPLVGAPLLPTGFDVVTVAEVAAAAEVSEKTVFNYFPTKAHRVFDEGDEILGALVATAGARPPDQSVLEAFERFLLTRGRQSEGRHRRPRHPSDDFRRLIEGSETLLRHRREMFARYEHDPQQALVADGSPPDEAFLVAIALVAVLRSRFELAATESGPGAEQRLQGERQDRLLALLRAGFASWGTREND